MPRPEPNEMLLPSVLDRLIDPDFGGHPGPSAVIPSKKWSKPFAATWKTC